MGKDKLKRFAENLTFKCLVQPSFEDIFHKDHPLKGHWNRDFFANDRPIILELGCGKGEYTIALADRNPQYNYIGVDIKGARMWRGAKTATERGMDNVGFLRTRIEFIDSFFCRGRGIRDMDHLSRPATKDTPCKETPHIAPISRILRSFPA